MYPKEDAVKITDNTGQRVLAVDTAYDKLPRELTAADMKLATLWLLAPKRMTGAHRGVGVKAVRYAYGEKRRKAVPVELAAAGPKMLPKRQPTQLRWRRWGWRSGCWHWACTRGGWG